MRTIPAILKKEHRFLVIRLIPIAAFAIPLLWLYLLEPASFEGMWKGRTFQLFFIWLLGLELVLDWETLNSKLQKISSLRTMVLAFVTVLPTVYVAASQYWGLSKAIFNWSTQAHITWANTMPLSTEYLVFGSLFVAIIYLLFDFRGLKAFSVPAFFLLLVGVIYTIDNVFPYGQFTPFQIFVPTTASLAAAILNLMGYNTSISLSKTNAQGTMTLLTAANPQTNATATFDIAWPCAGIESFLIFTVVILLFLKRIPIGLKGKVGYFAFGAAITYVINAFRIVNIFTTGMIYGENSVQVQNIHFYYGPLYAVIWIVSYPLIIIASQSIWSKIRNPKKLVTESQPSSPSPA